jgi:hypothetical protein
MDVGRVGSVFINAIESIVQGNAMRFTLVFKRPVDPDRLASAYRELIASQPTLRSRFEPGAWSPMTDREVKADLDAQIANLTAADTADAYTGYRPTNSGLPIRIRIADEHRLVLSLNHVFGNGKSVLYYIEELLRLYGSAAEAAIANSASSVPPQSMGMFTGLLWVSAYLSEFFYKAGRNSGAITVDLSRGKTPGASRRGYAAWTYLLTPDETRNSLNVSTLAGLTVTENLCLSVARVLLDAQPDKSRVCISVPTDLTTYTSHSPAEAPGNFTGSLLVQLWRERPGGDPLDEQTRRAFRWARRNVHYWTSWLVGHAAGSEDSLAAQFRTQAQRAIPQRAPFENFSCAVSSLGVVQGAFARKYLAAMSAHTGMQTIFVCSMTLNERLSIEVSIPKELFDGAEVAALTDRAVGLFARMTPEQAAMRRTLLHDGNLNVLAETRGSHS